MPQRVSSATAALLPPVLLPSPAGPTVLPLRAPSFGDQVTIVSVCCAFCLASHCIEHRLSCASCKTSSEHWDNSPPLPRCWEVPVRVSQHARSQPPNPGNAKLY